MVSTIIFNPLYNFVRKMFLLRLLKTARNVSIVRSLSNKGPLIDLTVDDEGIATLTLQRPPVNSINLELLQELNEALDVVKKNKAKGLIFTSASASVFSAGLDITEIYNPSIERLNAFVTSGQAFCMKLFSAPYPTAAAINGHAPAGGCMIAISCEYRTMVTGEYRIGLNESAVGIPVPLWLINTMCSVIKQRDAELALTSARMFSVDEAFKIGLIDEAASDKADAIEKCKKFIRRFDKISLLAHSLTKQRIRADTIQSLIKNREADVKEFTQVCLTPQVQKLLGMYLQKLKQKSTK